MWSRQNLHWCCRLDSNSRRLPGRIVLQTWCTQTRHLNWCYNYYWFELLDRFLLSIGIKLLNSMPRWKILWHRESFFANWKLCSRILLHRTGYYSFTYRCNHWKHMPSWQLLSSRFSLANSVPFRYLQPINWKVIIIRLSLMYPRLIL